MARPWSQGELRAIVRNGACQGTLIARGLGRSYGDASLNASGTVLVQTRLDRFLEWDEQNGILRCEGGTPLSRIVECFLPRGWFLPVTPGTKHVTVGGAIAADVHGKNHHRDGSFGAYVLDCDLLTSTGGTVTCSPSERPDLFWATLGGMGLTGIIISARMRLARVPSAYVEVDYSRHGNVDEALDRLCSTEDRYRYSVAWLDCLARGSSLGRSILMLGNDADPTALPADLAASPLALRPGFRASVPSWFPGCLLNAASVRGFNAMYFARQKEGRRIVDYDTFFYPLDRALNWNRAYGRRGFIQYQALFPGASPDRGMRRLLERIAGSRPPCFLAVLKTSGHPSGGMLSFLERGLTIALDFPNTGPELTDLLRDLDKIVLEHGGRVYMAKDAVTAPEAFALMYRRLDEFRRVKGDVDPRGRLQSSLSRRLGIVRNGRP